MMLTEFKFWRLLSWVCGKFSYSLILIILAFSLNSCQAKKVEQKRTANLVQEPNFKVYFNHNLAKDANYTDPYREINRSGDNLEQVIINQINSANASIDLAVQELNLPNIALALAQKKQAGVKVRVILENNYNHSLSKNKKANFSQNNENEEETDREKNKYAEYQALVDLNKDGNFSEDELNQRDTLIILGNANIPVIDDTEDGTKGSGLMHHKFMIIDQQRVVTGSANFTISDIHGDFNNLETRGNANHLLEIYSYPVAQIFTSEFNYMWGDGVGGKKNSKFGLKKPVRQPQTFPLDNGTITISFSPISPSKPWNLSNNGLISQTLDQATRSVDLALFVFSEQKIADTLNQKNTKGVKIRALIDPNFIFQNYSEGLDLLGVALANQKCTFEKDNKPWTLPIKTVGMANLPQGDKLHHKFALIDEKTIITGSHNWSNAANHHNDETLLIINNLVVANHFKAEFNSLYQDAKLGLSASVQTKLKEQKQRCPIIQK